MTLETVNKLLLRFGLGHSLYCMREVTPSMLIELYEAILQCPLRQKSNNTTNNIDLMIKTLSRDVLAVDLDHIRAEDIVNGNPTSIENIVEILNGLADFLEERLDNESCEDAELDLDLLSDHGNAIVNDVIESELSANRKPTASALRLNLSSDSDSHRQTNLYFEDFPSSFKESSTRLIDDAAGDNFQLDNRNSVIEKYSKNQKSPVTLPPATHETDVLSVAEQLGDLETDEEYEYVKNRLLERLREFKFDSSDTVQAPVTIDSALASKSDGKYASMRKQLDLEERNHVKDRNTLKNSYSQTFNKLKSAEQTLLNEKKTNIKKRDAKVSQLHKINCRPTIAKSKYLNKSTNRNDQAVVEEEITTDYNVNPEIVKDSLLPFLLEEFPHLELSKETISELWRKQMKQVNFLTSGSTGEHQIKHLNQAHRKQEILLAIMKKEINHNIRLKEQNERRDRQFSIRANLREQRQASARMHRYYGAFKDSLKARSVKKRSREETIFKKLFEESLQMQKDRVHEMRKYAREKRQEYKRRHQNQLESLENYYRDQFAILTETLKDERQNIKCKERLQAQTVERMKIDLRQRLEKDISDLQKQLVNYDDSSYFRSLEADKLKKQLSTAVYKIEI